MRKLAYVLISGLLVMGLFGCASAPAASGSTSSADSVSLSKWAGTWNNFYSYFENPALEEAYSTLALREDKTASEIKERYLGGLTYQCEIAGMRISADSITFYATSQKTANSNDNIVYTAPYSYAGPVDIGGRIWQHFETSSNNPYKHLLLLPAEADEPGKTMMHFHFRYGRDLDVMKSTDGWFPTMVQYDNNISLLIGHMTHQD